MRLWSIHSCFHWCNNYENWRWNARIIVQNKVVPFYETQCSSQLFDKKFRFIHSLIHPCLDTLQILDDSMKRWLFRGQTYTAGLTTYPCYQQGLRQLSYNLQQQQNNNITLQSIGSIYVCMLVIVLLLQKWPLFIYLFIYYVIIHMIQQSETAGVQWN